MPAGTTLFAGSLFLDATRLLALTGFPADRLYHPRVQGDLALIRVIGGLIGVILVASQVVFRVRPDAGRTFFAKVDALVRSPAGKADYRWARAQAEAAAAS